MFLRDSLQRCSELESEVAAVYEALATATDATPASLRAWTVAARRARQRSALLRALAEAAAATDDDGPFLVQVKPWIAELRRVLESARARLTTALDAPAALRCSEQLEATPRDELYATVLEVAEPGLRRLTRLVEAEIRCVRRAAELQKPRDAGRLRVPAVPASS